MKKPVTYASAGVDIDEGERMVSLIKPMVATTDRPGVLGGIGSFAGFFRFPARRFKDPVLVSGTDGVGTKVKIAALTGSLSTVGIDLVAMCVNDILVHGAEPLFFLDYYATGKLSADEGARVVSGVVEGCRQAGCALLGGETAEMPSVYARGEFDLAGFAVGAVDRSAIISGKAVRKGDVLIGLASSGFHSNGYSLVRKVVFDIMKLKAGARFPGSEATVAEELLRPTRIYVKPILALLKKVKVHGMAHITGGGIPGNVPRSLPKGCRAIVDRGGWEIPSVMRRVVSAASLEENEAYKTFNMGIGMVLMIDPSDAARTLAHFRRAGIGASVVGEVAAARKGANPVEFTGVAK
jgi:phosphoribosylformylglycinamidine cyclo-ligase